MNDTLKWIMVILLLLLIAAAVFVLLRSPGKDNDTRDRDAAVGRGDAERDGVPDARAHGVGPGAGAGAAGRGVYDQEADARSGGATRAVPPADRQEPAEPAVREGTTPAPVESADYDDTTTTAVEVPPAGAGETTGDVRPLTDDDVTRGGSDEPLDRQEQEPWTGTDDQAEEHPVGQEGTTYRAAEGEAVVVGEDRDEQDRTGEDPHAGPDTAQETEPAGGPTGWDAPADTGTGAPQTADEIVEGRQADETPGTATAAPVFVEAAYGPGSAEPLEDGTGPAGWEIKGNIGSMLFHTPESPSYDAVRAEVWFESEEAARTAGFAHWDRRRR